MKKIKSRKSWIIIGIVYAVFAAPHSTVVKIATDSADPIYWVFVRFIALAIVLTPFIILSRKKLLKDKAWMYALGGASSLAVAILLFTIAIRHSQASYVSIITLTNPISLVVMSWLILKLKITRRWAAGITLAATGAMILVVLPIAVSSGSMTFYPLATALGLGNSLMFSLGIILIRRANEVSKIPLTAILGINAYITVIVCGVLFYFFGDHSRAPSDPQFWLLALYSGFGVALFGRMIIIKVFEKLGSAFSASLAYFETMLAIVLPVFVLGENLSLTMVTGGVFILAGLYVIETHKIKPSDHSPSLRHH